MKPIIESLSDAAILSLMKKEERPLYRLRIKAVERPTDATMDSEDIFIDKGAAEEWALHLLQYEAFPVPPECCEYLEGGGGKIVYERVVYNLNRETRKEARIRRLLGALSEEDRGEIRAHIAKEERRALEEELTEKSREIERLQQIIKATKEEAAGAYWSWQGDGEDHLQSLTCGVMMQAEHLRLLISAAGNHVETPWIKEAFAILGISERDLEKIRGAMPTRYFRILGKASGQVIGACTDDGRPDVWGEEPGCVFEEITKEEYYGWETLSR